MDGAFYMDRQVRDQILQMLEDTSLGIQNSKQAQDETLLAACVTAIEAVAEVCQNELSAARYAHYQDIFDGMTIAFQQSMDAHMTADKLNEACDLSIELIQYVEKELKHDPEVKKEIVFLPYKASMWDSLESIWRAAAADTEHCNAYVVPLPYCDRNPDGTAKEWHCEINLFPKDVPVLDYRAVDLEKMHPDVIFIHNPYDEYNIVTSVDANYYSAALKSCTDLLMYVPYYATAGTMGEGQALCPAYFNVDYIVAQSERDCGLFDPSVPKEKLLPLGSPKFDRVMQMCRHRPEMPTAWNKFMQGKTVYFYNTSINGMLMDTKSFLKKMEYVFRCFSTRKNVCLLWRPHPLLLTTFQSMRPEFLPEYERLKTWFIRDAIGIYDDTSDIDHSIALSDVYIGDTGTSVTSLFGIACKPMFLLNNRIHDVPEENDWRGEVLQEFPPAGADEWLITRHNQLYYAADKHHYAYYCTLSSYTLEFYYRTVIPYQGRLYICPLQAQNILVVENHAVVKTIELKKQILQPGAFCGAWQIGHYIFLLPFHYTAVVRYDLAFDRLDYIQGCTETFVQKVQGEWRIGGSCVWRDQLLLASPQGELLLAVDSASMQVQTLKLPNVNFGGCMAMATDGDDLWMLPYQGQMIRRMNLCSGEHHLYADLPAGFQCRNIPFGDVCDERPFSMIAFTEEQAILSPCWGNLFVQVDKKTGRMESWDSPVPPSEKAPTGYFFAGWRGGFIRRMSEQTYRFFDLFRRRLYDLDVSIKEAREVKISFDREELLQREPGFGELSEWCRYGCEETAINSLPDLLDGTLKGHPFDRNEQLQAFGQVTANRDGTCGEHVYRFLMRTLGIGGGQDD